MGRPKEYIATGVGKDVGFDLEEAKETRNLVSYVAEPIMDTFRRHLCQDQYAYGSYNEVEKIGTSNDH